MREYTGARLNKVICQKAIWTENVFHFSVCSITASEPWWEMPNGKEKIIVHEMPFYIEKKKYMFYASICLYWICVAHFELDKIY